MRKRSTQEILVMKTAGGTPITSSSGRSQRIDALRKKVEDDRQKRQEKKPSIEQQKLDQIKYKNETDRIRANTAVERAKEKTEKSKNNDKPKGGSGGGSEAPVTKATSRAEKIAGKKPNLEQG